MRASTVRLHPLEALPLLATAVLLPTAYLTGAPLLPMVQTLVSLAIATLLAAIVAIRVLRLDPALVRLLAGVSLSFVIYGALPPLLERRLPMLADEALWQIERSLLGTTAVEVLQVAASPAMTAFFGLIYSLHAPLFYIPAIVHWRAGRKSDAEAILVAISLAMHLGFIGYFVWPAYGPVGTVRGLAPLGENVATQTVATYGVALGTFPSLHAAVCAMVAIDGWRRSRWAGAIFTLIAILIWISTLYLRYHWVPDLMAGLLLAILSLGIARQWVTRDAARASNPARSRGASGEQRLEVGG